MRFIRSVLLRERLDRAPLIWQHLRSIVERVAGTIHLTWSLLMRWTNVHLLLLLKHLLWLS